MTRETNPDYLEVNHCRIQTDSSLEIILTLGHQSLTGVFPASVDEEVPVAPLELCWSPESGLVQLKHSFSASAMYGDNYGYRSGLNPTMASHLTRKVEKLRDLVQLRPGDTVVDIGSNDGTLLNTLAGQNMNLIGFDPVAKKFRNLYDEEITVVEEFFDSDRFWDASSKKARLITSIAMFYDVESPRDFVRHISSILDTEGIWHFEQSYLPSMLSTTSYDTICHEHLEYYSFTVVKELLESEGLKVIDVETNSINGGSFAVSAAPMESALRENGDVISWLIDRENNMGLGDRKIYDDFSARVRQHKDSLVALVNRLNASGYVVAGYGASTKGNVLLQYCGFGPDDIEFIGDVNPYKHGRFTPGTRIPIISEEDMHARKPDYLLVLPWHFRDFIIEKESDFLSAGGRLLFPLPEIEIVG